MYLLSHLSQKLYSVMNLFTLISLGLVFYIGHHLFLAVKDIIKLIKHKRNRDLIINSKIETNIKTHFAKAFIGSFIIASITLLAISFMNFGPSDPKPSSQVDRQPIKKTIPLSSSRN
jgi:hypothetical protein